MYAEIKKRLNLSRINEFTREECEDRLLLLRYLLRREDLPEIHDEFRDYVLRIEKRLSLLSESE